MSEKRPEIVMYARERFCPDVTRARIRLERLGLEWTEYDVEADDERKQEMMQLTGRPNVPTLLIGNSILIEPSAKEIDAALEGVGFDVKAALAV
jgi:glutaredoxin